MSKYYICVHCGKTKTAIKKRPKCPCPGGNGKTFMNEVTKAQYISGKKNGNK